MVDSGACTFSTTNISSKSGCILGIYICIIFFMLVTRVIYQDFKRPYSMWVDDALDVYNSLLYNVRSDDS